MSNTLAHGDIFGGEKKGNKNFHLPLFFLGCTDDQWMSDNGDCIDATELCNGMLDCRDNSDEVGPACSGESKYGRYSSVSG